MVGMMNGSGDGKLRGIGTGRKRVRKKRKRVERKVGGGKKNRATFSTTPHKENPFSNS